MIKPGFKEFREIAEKSPGSNLVPVYRQLLADTLTPVSAFQRLSEGAECAFLLESVEGGENIGRYSFLGADPFLLFESDLSEVTIREGGETRKIKCGPGGDVEGTPLDLLRDTVRKFKPAHLPELPRFSGGAVGYLSYDTIRLIEKLPPPPPRSLGLPDIRFMFVDTLLIFDHVRNTLRIVAYADVSGGNIEAAYDEARQKIDAVVERLRRPVESGTIADDIDISSASEPEYESNFTREKFEEVVLEAKEYIVAGDVIQVVPSQRLHVAARVSPFDVYRTLRAMNPSPYMFHLKFGTDEVVGSSPEVMVRVEGSRITVRPIAGTRPRGATPDEDKALEHELLTDPKELAEHSMLLDLGRNDVGKVSEYGTVRVTEKMIIERYSHVMHIVSNVTGTLRSELDAFDALKSCLPAGTVSGAPKIRAMEIINELEADVRGIYAGAVGYFDFHGNMDTCIAIRTIVCTGAREDGSRDFYVQAGGGIVADSVPATEYEETLNKARALLRSIALAQKHFPA